MKAKIFGFLVCMLLIATTIPTVTSIKNSAFASKFIYINHRYLLLFRENVNKKLY